MRGSYSNETRYSILHVRDSQINCNVPLPNFFLGVCSFNILVEDDIFIHMLFYCTVGACNFWSVIVAIFSIRIVIASAFAPIKLACVQLRFILAFAKPLIWKHISCVESNGDWHLRPFWCPKSPKRRCSRAEEACIGKNALATLTNRRARRNFFSGQFQGIWVINSSSPLRRDIFRLLPNMF